MIKFYLCLNNLCELSLKLNFLGIISGDYCSILFCFYSSTKFLSTKTEIARLPISILSDFVLISFVFEKTP